MWIPASLWKSPGKKCKKMCIAYVMGRYITKYIIQKFTRIDMPRGREFWLQLQLQHHFTLTFKYSVGSLQLFWKFEKKTSNIGPICFVFSPFYVLSVFKIFGRIFFSWMLILDDYYWLLNTISTNFIVLDDVLVLWE